MRDNYVLFNLAYSNQMNLILISNQIASAEQIKLATQMGYPGVTSVGTLDALGLDLHAKIRECASAEQTLVVSSDHPNVALAAYQLGYSIVIWHNEKRPAGRMLPNYQCVGASRWTPGNASLQRDQTREYFKLE